MKQALVRGSLALILACGMGLVVASPASAATSQACKKVKGTLDLAPGLSATSTGNQKVTIKGAESSCAPTAKTGGTGAYSSVLVLKHANCSVLAKGGISFKGTATTKWKNGKTSTYSVTYKDGTGNNILKISMVGTVTKGLFLGKKFTAGFTLQGVNSGACTSKPFKHATWVQNKAWTIA